MLNSCHSQILLNGTMYKPRLTQDDELRWGLIESKIKRLAEIYCAQISRRSNTVIYVWSPKIPMTNQKHWSSFVVLYRLLRDHHYEAERFIAAQAEMIPSRFKVTPGHLITDAAIKRYQAWEQRRAKKRDTRSPKVERYDKYVLDQILHDAKQLLAMVGESSARRFGRKQLEQRLALSCTSPHYWLCCLDLTHVNMDAETKTLYQKTQLKQRKSKLLSFTYQQAQGALDGFYTGHAIPAEVIEPSNNR